MRVLVTGAAGFIGSHLCCRLVRDGHEVIGLDNFFTGSRKNMHPEVIVMHHDVCEPFHFDADQVYHLAAPASPVHYQRNPTRTLETILLGTRNALTCARNSGARLVISSTSEVYGDPLEHPQKESYRGNVNPLSVRGCYDEGKRAAETMAWGWAKQYGTSVGIARIFNTYGPRMNLADGRLIPNVMTQALSGKPITVYGDGSQTRSLCYVDDMVDGLVALMEMPTQSSMNPFLCNLGNPDERSVLDVARAVQKLAGSAAMNSGIEFEPLPQDDPRQRCPDITKAKTWLGWEPKVKFEAGLSMTMNWFRREVEAS